MIERKTMDDFERAAEVAYAGGRGPTGEQSRASKGAREPSGSESAGNKCDPSKMLSTCPRKTPLYRHYHLSLRLPARCDLTSRAASSSSRSGSLWGFK